MAGEEEEDEDEADPWAPCEERPRLTLDGQQSIRITGLRGMKAVKKTIDVEHYNTPLQSIWKTAIIDWVARLAMSVGLST